MSGTMNLTARAEQADSDRQLMHEVLLELRAQRAHSSDLFHHVMSQNRNGVLETGSLTIGTDGWVERDFRAAYAAIAVTNPSAAQVTVSSSPPAGFQPTGPGSGIIPAGCFGVLNLSSNSVTIYGTAGTKVTYSAFIDPQPPIICALAALTSSTGAAIVSGTSADNADGVAFTATGLVRSAAELFAVNSGSTGMDRLRMGRLGTLLVATGIGPFVALNAATVTGPGTTFSEIVCLNSYSMMVVVTGGPATINVNLEGSLDGVNWFVLGSTTNVAGDLIGVTGKPVNQIRANLTVLTGGAAPTVTVRIGAA